MLKGCVQLGTRRFIMVLTCIKKTKRAGMAMACFDEHDKQLELPLPNFCVNDDGTLKAYEPPTAHACSAAIGDGVARTAKARRDERLERSSDRRVSRRVARSAAVTRRSTTTSRLSRDWRAPSFRSSASSSESPRAGRPPRCWPARAAVPVLESAVRLSKVQRPGQCHKERRIIFTIAGLIHGHARPQNLISTR